MRKLGEALKQVVADGYETAEGEGSARSVLMNENRRRAFEYAAWHPCSTPAEVAKGLRVSGPTAAWHLRKLVEAGYMQEIRRGKRRSYLPVGLSLEPGEIESLTALSERDAPQVLALVLATPGLTGRQIAGRMERVSVARGLRGLMATGLLAAVADGRYRRYFPGSGLAALEKAAPGRLRDFRRRLLRRLDHDRLAPEARTAPADVLEVDVRFGEERATMRFPTGSLLAGRVR